MKKFKIKSFCKVNLTLKVLKKLSNGYHSIRSLITFCNPYDEILISKINDAEDKISFSGKFKKGIDKKSNTITKTLYLLRKKKFIKNQAFKINIKKNIPHGSGLGGGSSNAASLLNFFSLDRDFKLGKNDINRLAKQIGFDTTISLKKKNTILSGGRNKILRINKKFNLNILIVYPNIICSTKKIYTKNKKIKFSPHKTSYAFKNKRKLINFLKNENNDLEEIVTNFYPKIRKIIDFIKIQNGCYFSRITGSGSACIGIFSDVKTANFAQKLIKLKFPKYWCVVSRTI